MVHIETPQRSLLVENPVYKPFRYPWAYEAWLTQQRIHWLPEEVPLSISMQNGRLYLGPIMLMELPAIID